MIDRLKIRSFDELIATIPHTLGFILSWTTPWAWRVLPELGAWSGLVAAQSGSGPNSGSASPPSRNTNRAKSARKESTS